VLTNRTIIVAFAAHPVVLGTPDPTPLRPLRLPKHVRYRCATPRRFVLTKRTCFPSVAQKPSLAYTAPIRPSGPGFPRATGVPASHSALSPGPSNLRTMPGRGISEEPAHARAVQPALETAAAIEESERA